MNHKHQAASALKVKEQGTVLTAGLIAETVVASNDFGLKNFISNNFQFSIAAPFPAADVLREELPEVCVFEHNFVLKQDAIEIVFVVPFSGGSWDNLASSLKVTEFYGDWKKGSEVIAVRRVSFIKFVEGGG
jgi:hypothetical protein